MRSRPGTWRFVESESNLSFEPGDDAWIFDDAIACNDAYVDKGSYLRGNAIACNHAYVSRGALLAGHARAEDDATSGARSSQTTPEPPALR